MKLYGNINEGDGDYFACRSNEFEHPLDLSKYKGL